MTPYQIVKTRHGWRVKGPGETGTVYYTRAIAEREAEILLRAFRAGVKFERERTPRQSASRR